jgi:hypothetical protein
MLFKKQPSPRPVSSMPTLANIREAQDTTITALPLPPVVNEQEPPKEPLWRKFWVKMKGLLCFGKKEKEMCIGAPTDFKHVRTGGPMPLMGRTESGREDDE